MSRTPLTVLVLAAAMLAGCDMVGNALGIESPEKLAAARDADGRAIGGACRHAGRAIEDCYAINRKADKAAVFAGWREMNDYMRENKIEPIPPQLGAQAAQPAARSASVGADAAAGSGGAESAPRTSPQRSADKAKGS